LLVNVEQESGPPQHVVPRARPEGIDGGLEDQPGRQRRKVREKRKGHPKTVSFIISDGDGERLDARGAITAEASFARARFDIDRQTERRRLKGELLPAFGNVWMLVRAEQLFGDRFGITRLE